MVNQLLESCQVAKPHFIEASQGDPEQRGSFQNFQGQVCSSGLWRHVLALQVDEDLPQNALGHCARPMPSALAFLFPSLHSAVSLAPSRAQERKLRAPESPFRCPFILASFPRASVGLQFATLLPAWLLWGDFYAHGPCGPREVPCRTPGAERCPAGLLPQKLAC